MLMICMFNFMAQLLFKTLDDIETPSSVKSLLYAPFSKVPNWRLRELYF